jgi:hypothetical protein
LATQGRGIPSESLVRQCTPQETITGESDPANKLFMATCRFQHLVADATYVLLELCK